MPSPFRFLPSNKRDEYSVVRGESTRLGFITKVVHRIYGRAVQSGGWTPTTVDRVVLPIEKTKEKAANALWIFHQASQRTR